MRILCIPFLAVSFIAFSAQSMADEYVYPTYKMRPEYVNEHQGQSIQFKRAKVHYDSEVEQESRKVHIRGGKLYDATGVLLNTADSISAHKIFVMDGSGNIYIGRNLVEKFHHSSLVSGRPVAIAGEITVKDGVILVINNQSGHYFPRPDSMARFAEVLQRQDVDLYSTELHFFLGEPGANVASLSRELLKIETIGMMKEVGPSLQKYLEETSKNGLYKPERARASEILQKIISPQPQKNCVLEVMRQVP